MFNFIANNQIYFDECIYFLCGIVCVFTGIKGLKNKEARFGTFVFWTLLGLLFAFGKLLINNMENGGAIVGALLMVMGVLTLTKQVKIGTFEPVSDEEKRENSKKVGNKIFIPAITIGVVAMILAQTKSMKLFKIMDANGNEAFFGWSTALTLGLSALVSLIIAMIITKPKTEHIIDDTSKMLMQVGSSSLLPQLLGALGAVFATAGIGGIIGEAASTIVPEGAKVFGVIAYCLGMVIFTIIMGNAFAAFTVITLGVGIPFVIALGANPAMVGALGMTCGYCGTLLTPMAANFNIVPAAILETKDKYTIIKAQAPVAGILIVAHIVMMLLFAF